MVSEMVSCARSQTQNLPLTTTTERSRRAVASGLCRSIERACARQSRAQYSRRSRPRSRHRHPVTAFARPPPASSRRSRPASRAHSCAAFRVAERDLELMAGLVVQGLPDGGDAGGRESLTSARPLAVRPNLREGNRLARRLERAGGPCLAAIRLASVAAGSPICRAAFGSIPAG